jgi:hypothetical protein
VTCVWGEGGGGGGQRSTEVSPSREGACAGWQEVAPEVTVAAIGSLKMLPAFFQML